MGGPKLVGIARMAEESELLEAKQRVDYREIEARSYITKCPSPYRENLWTVNPYRGCEFGCRYCYARYAHEFMELRDPVLFETKIFAKRFRASQFRADLAKVPRNHAIWIGTATDPYQPAERRYCITRRMLAVAAQSGGHKIGITTKSDLVARDVDLLRQVSRSNIVHVNLTITTLDEPLARLLEPRAPRPALRIGAIRRLAENGIRTTALIHPIMPFINDSDEQIEAVVAAAVEAGVVSFSAAALFLKPCSRQVFLPFIERYFPHLSFQYQELYRRRAYLEGEYPERITALVRKLTEKYRLVRRGVAELPDEWPTDPQMGLFPG